MKFRCSSIGKLMTEAKSIAPELLTDDLKAIQRKVIAKRTEGEIQALEHAKLMTLSEGAKTYVRQLAKEEIYGIEFPVETRYMEKGIELEDASIAMLNRVKGLNLTKNTERKSNALITGECDLWWQPTRHGRDLKNSFSLNTFPAFPEDAEDLLYEYQMRGYMWLWDGETWSVDHALLSTPPDLIPKWEPIDWHIVDHIPEHHRLTTWEVKRCLKIEARMATKIEVAQSYMLECIKAFDRRVSSQNVIVS